MIKTLNAFLIIVSLLASPVVISAEQTQAKVFTKGTVCSFCMKGIEKRFKTFDEVEKISFGENFDFVILNFKKGKNLSDDVIKDEIKKSGYNVTKIERS